MNEIVSYILVGLCAILAGIVTYDLIKLLTRKRRHKRDEIKEVSDECC